MIYNHGILLRPVPFFWGKQNQYIGQYKSSDRQWCSCGNRGLEVMHETSSKSMVYFLVFRTMVDWSSSEFCIFIHTIRNYLNYVFLFTQTFVNNNVRMRSTWLSEAVQYVVDDLRLQKCICSRTKILIFRFKPHLYFLFK